MDGRPIGVFDSGLGGLTVAAELCRMLPKESIIYFGDTGRVPYGSRSRETILQYARQDVAFLKTFGLKAIVIACGTVSTVAIRELQAENTVPVIGVVEPAGLVAAKSTKNGRVGLLGTQASVRSGAYERVIGSIRPEIEVFTKACPLLVPLIEAGRIHAGDVVIETVLREYLAPMKKAGVDTLVLGCTHYPLIKSLVAAEMGEGVTLIDTGEECAQSTAALLAAQDLLAPKDRKIGQRRYYVSDSPAMFSRTAALFLGEEIEDVVEQVELGHYGS